MVEGIFFDAHGVLYERHQSTTPFALKLLAERGYLTEVSKSGGERLTVLRSQASDGRLSAETYWDEFLLIHGVAAASERTQFAARIMERPHQVFELPGARSTLEALKQRGFILGIITNTIYPLEWKVEWLAKVGVREFIDAVACSTAVGAHKPDPAIYLDALTRTSLTPGGAAFVGHEAEDLEGARQVGMTTVAVNYLPDTKADYFVQSLPDLLALPIFQGGHR